MAEVGTRFRQVSPAMARLVLALFALLVALCVLVAMGPAGSGAVTGPAGEGDLDTYRGIVAALQRGVPYYDALRGALLADGYGMQSIFNWRPPFFLSAVALSPMAAHGVLIMIAGAALLLSLGLVDGLGQRLGLVALELLGLAGVLAPGAAYLCELYAGALILLSVVAYARGWIWAGVAAAAAALLCRELSAIYVLVCIILAIRARRWRELAGWAVVLVAYAAYFGWHVSIVLGLISATDPGYAEGWVQLGGLRFVLATARFNGAFLLLPGWVTALLLPAALLGVIGWRGGGRTAAAILACLAAFAVIGKPVNWYWGALYTPLLALGAAWAPPALRDLIRAAR